MSDSELVREFRRFGWDVDVKNSSGLIKTSSGGVLLCGDGREPSDGSRAFVRGPKVFGGILGFAALLAMSTRSKLDIPTLALAVNLTQQIGFPPGMHDIDDHEVHCGQQNVAMKGGVYPKQLFTPQEGRDYVGQSGVNLHLYDTHKETVFGVNTIPFTTREPYALDQQFHVDYWFLSMAKLSEGLAVETGTKTIKALNSPVRKAIIYEG